MPGSRDYWLWSLAELTEVTMSREDGVPFAEEVKARRECTQLIAEAAKMLDCSRSPAMTAAAFVNRFYLFQSVRDRALPNLLVATTCLYIACKVEEEPRPLRDVVKVCMRIRHRAVPSLAAQFDMESPSYDPARYEKEKEAVLRIERTVLSNIGYDLDAPHPYKHIVPALAHVRAVMSAAGLKYPAEERERLGGLSWRLLGDSMHTLALVQFAPRAIAVASVELAARLLGIDIPTKAPRERYAAQAPARWYEALGSEHEGRLTPEVIDEVAHQLLDVYEETAAREAGKPMPAGFITAAAAQAQMSLSGMRAR